jgi:hypothetical protein
MASLKSKDKRELGRIEKLTHTLAYFDNGDILINKGDNWKLYGKIKKGNAPLTVYEKTVTDHNNFLRVHPHYANYLQALIRV